MPSVSPSIRSKFDSMPPDLQQAILNMGMDLNNMSDLMACLERIVAEGEKKEPTK